MSAISPLRLPRSSRSATCPAITNAARSSSASWPPGVAAPGTAAPGTSTTLRAPPSRAIQPTGTLRTMISRRTPTLESTRAMSSAGTPSSASRRPPCSLENLSRVSRTTGSVDHPRIGTSQVAGLLSALVGAACRPARDTTSVARDRSSSVGLAGNQRGSVQVQRDPVSEDAFGVGGHGDAEFDGVRVGLGPGVGRCENLPVARHRLADDNGDRLALVVAYLDFELRLGVEPSGAHRAVIGLRPVRHHVEGVTHLHGDLLVLRRVSDVVLADELQAPRAVLLVEPHGAPAVSYTHLRAHETPEHL